MVHALQETWRVLKTDGSLLDLRPLSSNCPIEIVTAEEEVQVGRVDAFGMAADDLASDQAIGHVVDEGWFVPVLETQFDFEFYWDTVTEMASFMEESRRMKQVDPCYGDLEIAHRDLCARGVDRARFRCRRPTRLCVYRKQT